MYRSPEKQWCQIMQKKYLDNDDPMRILTADSLINGSTTWKFMKESRHIITNHISWKIGNGRKARFWHNSWNGHVEVIKVLGAQEWIHLAERECGEFVVDYIEEFPLGSGLFRWKIPNKDYISLDSREKVREILESRIIVLNREEDEIIWCAAKSGEYKVNLGYQTMHIMQEVTEWPFRVCWDKMVAPRAGAFLWTAYHGRILTGERLKTYGIYGPSVCVMCKMAEETTNHLLYECQVARACWNWVKFKLGWNSVYDENFNLFIGRWPVINQKSLWGSLWLISPSMVVWQLWKERNRRIFCEKELDTSKIVQKISEGIAEIAEEGQFKLNFDGAAKGNPDEAGFGCIVRNSRGDMVAGCYGGLGVATNNEAEILALEKGQRLCIRGKLFPIIIEGDSQIIINAIMKEDTPNWKLRSHVKIIIDLLKSIPEFRLEHISREANKGADFLANKGVREDIKTEVYLSELEEDSDDPEEENSDSERRRAEKERKTNEIDEAWELDLFALRCKGANPSC
ncbi:hypothetical protein SUGI_0249820 [Cryptomeria japonica]|nr:hypothetical protein SUGI_0249820 [Cryptomeria japonica]